MNNTYDNNSTKYNSVNDTTSGNFYPGVAYNGVTESPYIMNPQTSFAEPAEILDFREKMAKKLGPASLIYAVFSTFCLYNNLSGITMPFFGIATLLYILYGFKQYGVRTKRSSWFYASVILALSISNFLTGNITFILFNNLGMFLMIFIFLLHNVYDDSRWNFSKTALSIFESFAYSIGALDDFSKDMKVFKDRQKTDEANASKRNSIKYILIGLLISIPVVGILLALLSNADIVFNNLLKNFSIDFEFGTAFCVSVTFLLFFFSGYCIMRFFSTKKLKEEVTSKRNLEPLIAITVLSVVSIIYLMFSVIQIVYLFLGGGSLPENYSYSEYAREGFFQLLAVSIINFLMVLFINNHFKESRVLKVLMTIISLCTYIMIASSFVRIMMYIDAALLTELRVWVLWGLSVLSLLFIAVIISIFKHEFPLFKYSIIVVSVLYIILSFARIDYIIADYNFTNISSIDPEIAEQDYKYMTRLSSDAAPIIGQYDNVYSNEYFDRFERNYTEKSWRQFNLSRYTAKLLNESR